MQLKLRVRGTNPKQPHKWSTVLETQDPIELDREADRMRRRYGNPDVQIEVTLSRGEKTRLTRAVLNRDQRQCHKCGSAVDLKVVSLRYDEYHNPDKLVTLCRACRHARGVILEEPYNEKIVAKWLSNGRTGIAELAEHFRNEYPDAYAEMRKALGTEGAAEFAENAIMETMFGANPFLGKPLSPKLVKVLQERVKGSTVPDAFKDDTADPK